MLTMLHRWLLRPRVLGLIAALVALCVLGFQLPASPAASGHFVQYTGQAPFDERPAGYLLSGVLADFRHLGRAGLADYTAYRTLDLVFPWLLCALVAGVMLRLDAPAATIWPWLAAIADTAENIALWRMLLTRDDLSPWLVIWASRLTQIKFGFYLAMLLALVGVGVRFFWRARRRTGGTA